jgi:5-methylcytosine-specific restriction endonuclease McrA
MKAYYQANKERLLAYYQANKERLLARHKEYRGENREKISARKKYYCQNNQERSRAYTQAYQQANPGKMSAKTSKRKAAKLQRTPNWLTKEDYHAIRTLYETAAALTKSTGIKHHVDHIIPLQGRTVSGFHCPTNLQILTQSENCSKNNKFTGEH